MQHQELTEKWLPVVGLEYNFEVSDLGRVRSIDRTVVYKDGRIYTYKGKVLSQWIDHHGYMRVHLKMNGRDNHAHVHRLVAEAFIENPDSIETVDHINALKTDNRKENLQWLSRSDNISKKAEDGTSVTVRGNARINFEIAAEIRNDFRDGMSRKDLCAKYEMSKSNICKIINNDMWIQTNGS